ncbi:hypothetical protein BpHYR1_003663 [Brachionus plicatilis]|uniref:Uncharacterized protein n=1 Tax=Brachionus plicatilis TaxID=10195 RepID=A0A3M7R658_BRAPC|nr:hypothetical protein BpHYR1_003663 [Brachionus plicatilis]
MIKNRTRNNGSNKPGFYLFKSTKSIESTSSTHKYRSKKFKLSNLGLVQCIKMQVNLESSAQAFFKFIVKKFNKKISQLNYHRIKN